MKRTTIVTEEALLLELKHLAKERHTTMAELIRTALRDFTQKHRIKRKSLSFVACGHSGKKDISSRAEDILKKDVKRGSGWR